MRTEKLSKIRFKDLGTPSFSVETSSEHIKLHTLMLCVAKKGSGKTFFTTNLLRMLPFDRIIIVSPTFNSNKKMMEQLNINEQDILDPDDPNVIQKIYDIVNQERDELEMYREKLKLFEQFEKQLKTSSFISDDFLLEFFNGQDFVKPTHKYGGRNPNIAVYVDDAQNSKIMGSKLSNLCIRHRHLGSFNDGSPALGVSLFISVQNYTAQGHGLPKAIRGNASHLAVWRTGNKKELELLAREQSGEVDEETFYKVYNFVFNENAQKHDFLFVDLAPKQNHTQFRKNYNEMIHLD